MPKQKYYVVWKGRRPGIFTSWAETEEQVKGFAAAQYKSFETLKEAEAAYRSNYEAFKGKPSSQGKWREASIKPFLPSICVDAACSGSPGALEYRGVFTESEEEIFRAGPFPEGTNNVG
ncbi:MAG TPA: ribonuclease H family protein, partial [Terriglobales bacterium]|nr:ribonuclease H family protein [Terriglobales bacterium]